MAADWHYAKGGQRHGPVTMEELRRLATTGQLQPSDLVWQKGMPEWQKAELIKGLFPPQATKSVVPPLSTATAEWHYSKGGQQHGPVTMEQLRGLAASGQLQAADLLWRKGMAEWRRAESVDGLFAGQAVQGRPAQHSAELRSGSQESPLALWNPNAARAWSLLFTWGFGAFLIAKNWKTLGDEERAKHSMYWFYSLFPFLLLALATPDTSAVNSVFRMAGLGILVAWSVIDAEKQVKYVKERFGNEYLRRPWGKPLGIAACCIALPVLGFPMSPDEKGGGAALAETQFTQTLQRLMSNAAAMETAENVVCAEDASAQSISDALDVLIKSHEAALPDVNALEEIISRIPMSQIPAEEQEELAALKQGLFAARTVFPARLECLRKIEAQFNSATSDPAVINANWESYFQLGEQIAGTFDEMDTSFEFGGAGDMPTGGSVVSVSGRGDSRTPSKSIDGYGIDDEFQLGDYKYRITGVNEQSFIGNQFINARPSAGATFLIVSYTIENCTNKTQTVLAEDFTLVDSKGREFRPSSEVNTMLAGEDKDLFFSELQPGIARRMKVGFEVPESIPLSDFTLSVPEKGLFSSGKMRVRLADQ